MNSKPNDAIKVMFSSLLMLKYLQDDISTPQPKEYRIITAENNILQIDSLKRGVEFMPMTEPVESFRCELSQFQVNGLLCLLRSITEQPIAVSISNHNILIHDIQI